MNSNEMIDVDLPSLQSIQLGGCALRGRWDDDSSSLIMRSNNELIGYDLFCRSSKSTSITSVKWSFYDPRVVTLASISEY